MAFLTSFRATNIRGWKDTGLVRLAPITLFTGQNKSGKTTLLEILYFLKQEVKKTRQDYFRFVELARAKSEKSEFEVTFYASDLDSTEAPTMNMVYSYLSIVSVDGKQIYLIADPMAIHDELANSSQSQTSSKNAELVFTETYKAFQADMLPLRPVLENLYFLTADRVKERTSTSSIATPYNKAIRLDGGNWFETLFASRDFSTVESMQVPSELEKQVSKVGELLGLWEKFGIEVTLSNDEEYLSTFEDKRMAASFNLVIETDPNTKLYYESASRTIKFLVPLMVLLYSVPKGSIVLIETPEIHLHPDTKRELADWFIGISKERDLQLIIESYSPAFLERFQRRIAEEIITPEYIAVHNCFYDKQNGCNVLSTFDINEYGEISNWAGFLPHDFEEVAAQHDAIFKRVNPVLVPVVANDTEAV
jgi:AAA15 family ATPase/GTPase